MSTGDLPPFAQASAGAIGAAVSNSIVYPLDLLTTRLQTQTSKSKRGRRQPSGPEVIVKTVKKIIKEEGFLAFYRGISSDTLSTCISNFLYFYAYTFLRTFLLNHKERRLQSSKTSTSSKGQEASKVAFTPLEELAIGSLAGIISRFFTAPLSNITVRKQTASAPGKKEGGIKRDGKLEEKNKEVEMESFTGGVAGAGGAEKAAEEVGKIEADRASKEGKLESGKVDGDDGDESDDDGYGQAPSATEIVKEIYEEKGITGLWSGFASSVILTVNPAINFYLFEAFKRAIIPSQYRDKPTTAQTFITSATASAIASTITYPLILSKTRLQWKSPSGKRVYKSTVDVFVKTLKSQQGVAGMYQGLGAQISKGFFSQGITMVTKQRVELLIIYVYRLIRNRSQGSQ